MKKDKTYETEPRFPKDRKQAKESITHLRDRLAEKTREMLMWSNWIDRDIKRLQAVEFEIAEIKKCIENMQSR